VIRKNVREIQLSIRKISEKASEKEDCVRLDIGQPSFDTPQHVKEAARNFLDEKQGYTSTTGIQKLREKIAEEESMKSGVDVRPEEVMVTTGGMEAIFALFSSRLDEDDTLLVNDPSWGPYRLISAVNGNGVEQTQYFHNGELTEDVKEKAEKADMIAINSPSNPEGRVLSRDESRAIAELAEDKNCFLMTDEVYWRLTFDEEHQSPAAFNDNSALIGSVSKNHAMTGWRIGWIVDDSENIKEYAKVSRAMTAAPNKIGQLAAFEALDNSFHVGKMRDEYRKRRDYVVEQMKELGWGFTDPEGAIYAFPEVGKDSWEFAMEMIDEGVAVVPGEPFGSESDRSVRIAYGAAEMEELEKGFERLKKAV
jgi:aspartate aminotransferase